jgi:hypothetical protein
MLGSFGKMCSKFGTFYDSPVLLALVRSTSSSRQGAAENLAFFYGLSLGTLWTKVVHESLNMFTWDQNM